MVWKKKKEKKKLTGSTNCVLIPYASFITREVILSKRTFSFRPSRFKTYILRGESTGPSSFLTDTGVAGAAIDIV